MKKVIILNKKEGQTPLLALESYKRKNPKYADIPMTYAGRLDPMASGVLVILAGKKIKDKEKYLSLNKEYSFSVLLGFGTDTYDILGKVVKSKAYDEKFRRELVKRIKDNLKYYTGNVKQTYPAYSSKTVKGRLLFDYARNNEEVILPERNVFVKELIFKNMIKISGEKLMVDISKRIKKVVGNFRQDKILQTWSEKLLAVKDKSFFVASFSIKCSSGTYVRALANSLGEKLRIPALAFSIKRTKVGRFFI